MKELIAICGLDCETCEIRQCAVAKGCATCADCPEAKGCATLGKVVANAADAFANLGIKGD